MEKATINPKNTHDRYFQYAATVALNYEEYIYIYTYILYRKYYIEYIKYMKTDKIPFTIYADIESLIRKIDECANNAENSLTIIIGDHIPCG